MNPHAVSSAVQYAAKGLLVAAAAILAYEHVLSAELAATLAMALLSLGMTNGATILSRAAAIGAAASAATIASSIPPPPGPSPAPPPIPKAPPVPPGATLAILVGVFAGSLCACGASQQERDVAEYQLEMSACFDSPSEVVGMQCLAAVQRGHCGPGGVWYGAGLCSDVQFTKADGGLAP